MSMQLLAHPLLRLDKKPMNLIIDTGMSCGYGCAQTSWINYFRVTMNVVFFVIVLTSFVAAGWRQLHWASGQSIASPMESLTKAVIDSAGSSVELALGLIGVMTLFLGLVKVAEAGGLLRILSRLIRPLMIRLFPDVPPDHPAMGAMILNMSANALGLGNAATPFGIRAMQELDKLNSRHGTATDSMALFLAINTSSVTLLPTGVIALRAAAGSSDPAGILSTTLFATLCSTLAAICAAKIYARFFRKDRPLETPRVGLDDEARQEASGLADDALRMIGFSSMLLGVIILYFVR